MHRCFSSRDALSFLRICFLLCISLVVCACAQTQRGPVALQQREGVLTVHFIDVGQGDAIFVQAPEKKVLVDGGPRGEVVLEYLVGLGVDELDIVVATHPHADHIGGLIPVLEALPVREVIDPAVVHTTRTFEEYLRVIDRKQIPFRVGRAGMRRELGAGIWMEVLHPHSPSARHLNDASLVVRIVHGEISILLTGDAERQSEQELLASAETLKSTVLKVGHHGSRTSSTREFLSAVQPEIAVIMCGAGNSYGHPHPETLATLNSIGAKMYRTDRDGTVVFKSTGRSYAVYVGGAHTEF